MTAASERHTEWDAMAVGHALSALEPGEQRAFASHLAECARCKATVAEVGTLGAAIGTSLPSAPPATDLRGRVLSAAFAARTPVPVEAPAAASAPYPRGESAPTALDTNAVPLRPVRSRQAARWFLSAVAAILLVAVAAAFTTVLRTRTHEHNVADSRSAAVRSLMSGSSGVVVPLVDGKGNWQATIVAHDNTVGIVTDRLPRNAVGTTYVLWGIAKSGDVTPKAIAVFRITAKGLTARQLAADQREQYTAFAAFAVSREKGSAPPATPSTLLAEGAR